MSILLTLRCVRLAAAEVKRSTSVWEFAGSVPAVPGHVSKTQNSPMLLLVWLALCIAALWVNLNIGEWGYKEL